MADIFLAISRISYISFGILFLIVVFFWFKFKIPSIISDLSGRTAKKSIERIREDNNKSGSKSYRPSSVNANRGKLTDTMQQPKRINKDTKISANIMPETGILEENKSVRADIEETQLLNDDENTTLLNNETTVLNMNVQTAELLEKNHHKTKIILLEEVVLIHTKEEIL